MKKLTSDTIDAAVRDLDPAPEAVLTEAERRRADGTRDKILTTDPYDPGPAERDRPPRRRRLLASLGLVGAAAAAVPVLLIGGGSALASWTPTPEVLTPAETDAAASTCRADLGMPGAQETALLAERRGTWTYVLISGPRAEASCLLRNDVVGQDPAGHEVFGSLEPDPGEAPAVSRDGLVETGSAATSIDDGLFGEEWLTWAYGRVGAEVTAVTVHTPLGFDVTASVDNGRFAAWWPSQQPSSENLDVMGAWSYTVTLADGSTGPVAG